MTHGAEESQLNSSGTANPHPRVFSNIPHLHANQGGSPGFGVTSRHVAASSSEGYECEDDVAVYRPGSFALTVTECDVGGRWWGLRGGL